jgi:uncharacterized protein (DUF2237 family)
MARNVIGTELEMCSQDPLTGASRSGRCDHTSGDLGMHFVCAVMTQEFLSFSSARGNDLEQPNPQMAFPGLRPGDRWCVCVARWLEAHEADVAPPVVLEATHISTLEFVDLDVLQAHAVKA